MIETQIAEKGGFKAKDYKGSYHPEYFLGFCNRVGVYDSMEELTDTFDFKDVYSV
jgi:hypothetical protein